MSDAQEFGRCRTVDLSRLNDAERRVLRMLAEGHTVKSIANATGATPAAVNERLREARRKTEVGSSRELARLLSAQENRDEQNGVARQSPPASPFPQFDAGFWRPQTGVYGMIAVFLVAATGAAALLSHQFSSAGDPPKPAISDPLFDNILAESDQTKLFASPQASEQDVDRVLAGEGFRTVLRQLHTKDHSEPRDPAWAPFAESRLRAAFLAIPNIGAKGTELRVHCGSTLCEVAGTVEAPLSKDQVEIDEFNQSTMSRLNPKALEPETDKLRLKSMLASIGTIPHSSQMSYVFYYSRVPS